MKKALIIGASGGIGEAIATRLEESEIEVTRLSRSRDQLDVTDADSVNRVLGELTGPFDLILVTTGILAPQG